MRQVSSRATSVGFHLLALTFFAGCAVMLTHESRALGGRRGMMEMAVAVAAGGLALLSFHGGWVLLRERALLALEDSARVGTYLLVLAMMGGLLLLGMQLLHTEQRSALGAFCLGLAAWLGGLGLRLIPTYFLGAEGFVDTLGRRTRFSKLEWFRLSRPQGQPPRVRLQAGRGQALFLEVRLAEADAKTVRTTLLKQGLLVGERYP